MIAKRLDMPGVFLLQPKRFEDERGFFSETYNARTFAQALEIPEAAAPVFVQDNHSYSARAGTVRGLHFQAPPSAQAKLVRAARGRVLDVVLDIRQGSPTYLHWDAVELSAETGAQVFIPEGLLHGFVTLEDDAEVLYKTTDFYDRAADRSVFWADEALGVDWGVAVDAAILSKKDAAAPRFSEIDNPFRYDSSAWYAD